MPVVERRHLEHLADALTGYLRGDDVVIDTQRLGPLLPYVMTHTGWRPDWPARARRGLAQAIRGFAAAHAGNPAFDRRVTALGMLWGVDEFPGTTDSVARRLGVARDTVGGWLRDALDEEGPRESIALDIPADGPGPETVGTRHVQRWAGDAGDWPPAGHFRALAASLLRVYELSEVTPRELREILRRMVMRYAKEVYLRHDQHADLMRQFAHDVVKVWRRDSLTSFSAPPESPPPVGDHGRSVAAVTHLLAYELVADDLHRDRFDQADAELETTRILLGVTPDPGRRRAFYVPTDAHDDAWTADETRRLGGFVVGSAYGGLAARTTPLAAGPRPAFDGVQAFAEAEDMRAAHPTQRPKLAEEYVRRRSAYRRFRGRPLRGGLAERMKASRRHDNDDASVDGALLALADQAVHLIVLNLERWDLLDELSRAIRRTDRSFSYAELEHRNQGLRFSKLRDHARGIHWIVAAERRIDERVLIGGPIDSVALLESAHQIALAAAGVCIRVVEEMIAEDDAEIPPEIVRGYAVAALRWSWVATERLDRLDRVPRDDETEGLPQSRYDDLHISWRGWRALTRLHLLRARIVVRAAILGGLLPERALHPEQALGSDPSVRCDLEAIDEVYREIIRMPEIEAEHLPAVVIQSLWIAAMSNGIVPCEPDSTPLIKETVFLTVPPDDPAPRPGDVMEFSFPAAAEWVASTPSFVAGVFGYLSLDSPVGAALVASSDGKYTEWRASVRRFQPPDEAPGGVRY